MCRVLTKTSYLPGISLLLSYLISFHVTLLPNKRNHDSSLVPEIFTHCRDNIAAASTFIGGFCPYCSRRRWHTRTAWRFAVLVRRLPPTTTHWPLWQISYVMIWYISKEDTVKEVDVKNKRRLGLQTTSISTTGTCCRYQSPSPSAVSIILDCNLYCKFKAVFFLSFFLRGTN